MNTLSTVRTFIGRQHLLHAADRVLVALSGGADSVALLRLLLAAGYTCQAAHCNFRLRGDESDRDEAFVVSLCQRLQVPLHVRHFDTAAEARHRGISIEMAARELRYAWFEELRTALDCTVVAVAHHRDDSIETLLLNLVRGTGLNGLTGIRPRNGHIVRPLLCLSRDDITAYLDGIGQPYVTDSTNQEDLYTRNKIRLRLLPLMEELNPSVRATLARTADHLSDAAAIYRRRIDELRAQVTDADRHILIPALLATEAPHALLFELLYPLGFNSDQAEDIFRALDGQPGKTFVSATHRLVKDRDRLLVEPLDTAADTAAAAPRLVIDEAVRTPDFVLSRSPHVAMLDADSFTPPLTLRRWKQGDRFVPLGMKGEKLVSDYLTDRKCSLPERERQQVVCDADGRIVWLVGQRIDHRCRITDSTVRMVTLRVE
ncbi:MAG: tRNA lysidine(34) synthetase TilS [Prevotellaceae bacterium]|jgi:tRNA(Ile)-lysidine synthase|nr:tRNA lysidine(34) synthetase TilS [Prevotellaceae bacterium]